MGLPRLCDFESTFHRSPSCVIEEIYVAHPLLQLSTEEMGRVPVYPSWVLHHRDVGDFKYINDYYYFTIFDNLLIGLNIEGPIEEEDGNEEGWLYIYVFNLPNYHMSVEGMWVERALPADAWREKRDWYLTNLPGVITLMLLS